MTDPNPNGHEPEGARVSAAPAATANRGPSQAERLIGYARSAELFHAPDGEAYATVGLGGHQETCPLKSGRFTRWLTRSFYREAGKAPSAQALTDARATIAAIAAFDGPELPVFVRVAGYGDAVYLDLCDERWQVAEVTATGWRVLSSEAVPVRFVRRDNAAPLPCPVAGGGLDDLKPLLNVRGEEDFRLLVGWLIGALNPEGPYPVLVLQGEQGSAKSTTVRVLRSVTDPAVEPLRAPPRDERDLAIAASGLGHEGDGPGAARLGRSGRDQAVLLGGGEGVSHHHPPGLPRSPEGEDGPLEGEELPRLRAGEDRDGEEVL